LTTNKINLRSTLATLAFGALVTVLPASADTVSFVTSSSPTSIGVGSFNFSFSGATVLNQTVGQTPTLFNQNTSADSFGGFTVSGLNNPGPASQVIDLLVQPTNASGVPVSGLSPIDFGGKIMDSAGVYSLVFAADATKGTSAGTGLYAGDIIKQEGGEIYAVKTTTTLSPGGNKSFYITGIVGAVAPEPATMATTGLAAAFLGLFLRRKAKRNS
jgi:hypothetical protein